MGAYDQLQNELLEITAEISEQEKLQDETAAAITQADIEPMARVFQARYDGIVARLKGLYARKARAEEAMSGAELDQTIERAAEAELSALKGAYHELDRVVGAEESTYNALCSDQRARLQAFLETLKAERSAAAEPLKAAKARKSEVYRELRYTHGVAMGAETGSGATVSYGDLVPVLREHFGSDLEQYY